MMSPVRLAILMVFLFPYAGHAEVVIQIGEFRLTMPDGYRHNKLQGIDSLAGEIVSASGIKIEYDIGGLAGCPQRLQEMSKDELANVLYFEDHPANAPTGFILVSRLPGAPPRDAPAYAVYLALGKHVGHFGVQVIGLDKLSDARKAIAALKIERK